MMQTEEKSWESYCEKQEKKKKRKENVRKKLSSVTERVIIWEKYYWLKW